MTELQLAVHGTADEYGVLPTEAVVNPQCAAISHWWHVMLFLLQHHRLSWKDFSQFVVC